MEDIDEDNSQTDNINEDSKIITTYNPNQNQYIKTHTSLEENTINEENFDISNINYNYVKNNNLNNDNNEEFEEEDENDLSSEDEYENRLNNIKIGILKVKLNIFNKIVISKIKKYFYYFISKINLKIKCNEIFLQDDNFLYSKLKLKTSDTNKFYALKKLIYVIRKNILYKLIKQNYFYQWKIQKENKYIFNKNEKNNNINIIRFCSILIKIFNKRLENNFYLSYFIKKWKVILKEKEIYKNKIKKGMLILSNLFNRKIRKVFKKFPRNYLNLKQKVGIFKTFNDNKQINYIVEDNEKFYLKGLQDFYNYKKKYMNLLRQNKLLKIIEKLDLKNKTNRNVFNYFHILKNSSKISKYRKQIKNLNKSLIDLKYDSMLNAAIIIKIILNEHMHNWLFIHKKNFIDELYSHYKYTIIRNKYNYNKEIINEEEKEEVQNIRMKYRRIFALQKILIINNRHKFFYGELNIQLKFSLLMKYFKIWKKYVFHCSIDKYMKKLAIQKIYLLLNNMYINKIKKKTFYIIKRISIQKMFNMKKYCYFSFFIYLLLKQHILLNISKNIFIFIKQIWIAQQNSKLKNQNKYFKCMKLYLNYKKYCNIKIYRYLTKWYFICSCFNEKTRLFQEKMKLILINLNDSNNYNLLSKIFNKWHKKAKENLIEEQKKQIKIYLYLNKFVSMKHLKTLWLYFKKWSVNSNDLNNEQNYENLLTQTEQIRKENDDLIAIYYKKRQEYAKTLYDYNYMKKYYCEDCINEKEDEIDYMSLKSNDIKEAGNSSDSLMISKNKIDINKENYKYLKKSFGENSSRNRLGMPICFDANNFVVNEENKVQTNHTMTSIGDDDDELSNYVGKKISECTGETLDYRGEKDMNNNNENNIEINENDNINDYKIEYEEQKKYYENYINILLEKKNELIQMKNMLMSQKSNTSKSE